MTPHLIHRIVFITLATGAFGCGGPATPVEPGPITPPSPPRFSIQGALDAAVNGAMIVVPSGDYAEAVHIVTPGVTLRAAPGVTLDGAATGGVGISIEAPDVEVSGFTIRGFTVAIRSQGARCRIVGNIVEGTRRSSDGRTGAIELLGEDWSRQVGAAGCEVSGNTIRDIRNNGIVVGGASHLIRDNVVSGAAASGIEVAMTYQSTVSGNHVTSSESGIHVTDHGPKYRMTTRNVVSNNHASGNLGSGIVIGGYYTRENRIEANVGTDNGQANPPAARYDFYDALCATFYGNLWINNAGSTNCPALSQ